MVVPNAIAFDSSVAMLDLGDQSVSTIGGDSFTAEQARQRTQMPAKSLLGYGDELSEGDNDEDDDPFACMYEPVVPVPAPPPAKNRPVITQSRSRRGLSPAANRASTNKNKNKNNANEPSCSPKKRSTLAQVFRRGSLTGGGGRRGSLGGGAGSSSKKPAVATTRRRGSLLGSFGSKHLQGATADMDTAAKTRRRSSLDHHTSTLSIQVNHKTTPLFDPNNSHSTGATQAMMDWSSPSHAVSRVSRGSRGSEAPRSCRRASLAHVHRQQSSRTTSTTKSGTTSTSSSRHSGSERRQLHQHHRHHHRRRASLDHAQPNVLQEPKSQDQHGKQTKRRGSLLGSLGFSKTKGDDEIIKLQQNMAEMEHMLSLLQGGNNTNTTDEDTKDRIRQQSAARRAAAKRIH